MNFLSTKASHERTTSECTVLYDRAISFSFAVQRRMKDEADYKIAKLKSNDVRAKGDFTYPSFFGFHGIHTCAELKSLRPKL